MIANKYEIQQKIGNGSFGSIFKGINQRTREKVAIKIEPIQQNTKLLKNESIMYQYLKDINGIPNVKWFGKDATNYYMVIPLLGESLEDYKNKNQQISLETIKQIGKTILILLESIHEKGLVHRDIKPDNFLFDISDTCITDRKLNLIDFGFCKSYLIDNEHISEKRTTRLIGSANFASINSHDHYALTRRDDLISLGYILYYLYYNQFEWSTINIQMNYEENNRKIRYLKCKLLEKNDLPGFLKIFLKYTYHLKFDENPDYKYIENILK
jgi:serine/threonine protein kinase